MGINKIGVIGAGIMGSGITQVCAVAGLDVLMIDVNEAATQRGLTAIGNSLARQVKKEKITEADRTAALSRIKTSLRYEDIADRDLVIEAATENEALKLKILRDIDALLPPESIVVSNTSSYSITKLAAATKHPERFMGMHFFNPVPVMELVEVVGGMRTSEACFATVHALAERLGKKPVAVKNSPGFVVNRILCPMINEAIFAFQEGLAPAEQIDSAMKLGTNMPVGPLELADIIGLDTLLTIMQTFYEGFEDTKYRPVLLLKEMVDAGFLGRKSGQGFYTYE
jgi:3-hydroxybutyryl-CoA dehydrogenase